MQFFLSNIPLYRYVFKRCFSFCYLGFVQFAPAPCGGSGVVLLKVRWPVCWAGKVFDSASPKLKWKHQQSVASMMLTANVCPAPVVFSPVNHSNYLQRDFIKTWAKEKEGHVQWRWVFWNSGAPSSPSTPPLDTLRRAHAPGRPGE